VRRRDDLPEERSVSGSWQKDLLTFAGAGGAAGWGG
jgi:hypothetical protein